MSEPAVPSLVRPPALPQAGELVEVGSDRHAVDIWIASYSRRSPHTVRNFRREAERFLMWLEAVRGPGASHLPSVTVEDVNEYLDFVQAPRPFAADLLARYGKTDQPFRGTLSPASIRQTIVILHRMFEALRNVRGPGGSPYIVMNPWILVRDEAKTTTDDEIEEALTREEWIAVEESIEALPRETDRDKAHYHRTRWVFQLLYRAFLRRDEAAKLKMGAFEYSSDGWKIKLTGKGRKTAKIVATSKLMSELRLYRRSCGLPDNPAPGEDRPTIMSIIGKEKPVTDQLIYMLCKVVFENAAARIEASNPAGAEHLRRATPHWMRHTGITHALEAGIDPRYVQAEARHSSLAMTSKYDHKDRLRWREQMERL